MFEGLMRCINWLKVLAVFAEDISYVLGTHYGWLISACNIISRRHTPARKHIHTSAHSDIYAHIHAQMDINTHTRTQTARYTHIHTKTDRHIHK